jgi:hypothetical protein
MPSRLDARLQRLEAQAQGTDDLPGPGLSGLLASVERHLIAEAFDPESPLTGLGRLLWEARHARAKEPPV